LNHQDWKKDLGAQNVLPCKKIDSPVNEFQTSFPILTEENGNNELFLELPLNKKESLEIFETKELKLFTGTNDISMKILKMGSDQAKENDLSRKTKFIKENKSRDTVNLMNVFKRAKIVAKKIKKNLFFKNYLNMTNHQKQILNDKTSFSGEKKKGRIFKTFVNFNKIIIKTFFFIIKKN